MNRLLSKTLPALLGVALALAMVGRCCAASRLALVIGNDAYVGEWRLPSCVNDARAIAKWLASVGYEENEVSLVTDVKRAQMIAALESLKHRVEAEHPDQVFFYYSGHGLAIADDNQDEGEQDGMDEAIVAIDDPRQAASVEDILIRDDVFFQYISEMAKSAGQVFVLMDCCYSGGLTKSLPRDIPVLDQAPRKAKFIHAQELKDMIDGTTKTKGLIKVPPAQSKAIGNGGDSNVPVEIKRVSAEHGVVFLSASNQFQLSRAGKPLSAFTEAFLKTVGEDRQRLAAVHGGFTLDVVRQELLSKLYNVPQSPVLECQPADAGLDKSPFIPGLFPTPASWEEQQEATDIVAQLLSLPESKHEKTWQLEVACTKQPPLKVGEQFALQVKTNAPGHIVMFTVGASGQVTFLYPNRHRLVSKIGQSELQTLPWRDGLKVQPPVGAETFYVYLLDRDLFETFEFGKTAGAMAAGDLEGVLRRNPAARESLTRVNPAELGTARSRGMIVERVAEALRADVAPAALFDGGAAPRWTRAVVTLNTVE
ncbi:MAG: caspase family protein [Planctomycetales bacterium]|nr:caspase family protein [Planctomycetales bacterium]